MLVESAERDGEEITRDEALRHLNHKDFTNGSKVCFIAYYLGLPAGIVIAERHENSGSLFYDVRNLYVRREYRGEGIAIALLRKVASWASAGDAPVYITTKGDPRGYYKALGFEATHRICATNLKTIRERLRGMG